MIEIGSIALCKHGDLGVIVGHRPATEYMPQMYYGVKLHPDPGRNWQSNAPKVIGHVRDLRQLLEEKLQLTRFLEEMHG